MSAVTSYLADPHHDGSPLYVSNPHPSLGESVTLKLRVPAQTPEQAVWVRAVHDGEPIRVQARLDSADGDERWYAAELTVHNPIVNYRWLLVEPDGYRWVTDRGTFSRDVSDAGDFRITTHPASPSWVEQAVVYQIFPDRFARSPEAAARPMPSWAVPTDWNQPPSAGGLPSGKELYGGDLAGITEHLDYLIDLGVNTVYLTPFFPGNSVHRYDANSFSSVDPLLGGNQALAELSNAIHECGLRIIGDITTNHTGVHHGWMRLAQQDPNTPEHRFYYWYGSDEAPVPKNGSQPRTPFVTWQGVSTLPKLNWTSAELIARMIAGPDSVIGKWLQPPYSLDGWRVDVANMTGRYRGHDLTSHVAKHIAQTVRGIKPDGIVVAEHFHDASADLPGDGWMSNMNYSAFTRPLWAWLSDNKELDFLGVPAPIPRRSGTQMVETMREFDSAYPWVTKVQLWNMLGSHDTPRIRTVVGSLAAVEVAAAMLFTYPGVPAIFMGDEGGFMAATGEAGRKTMPWDEIAGAASQSAASQRQERWEPELHDAYRSLIQLHHDYPALRTGSLRWVFAADEAVGYLRETADQRIFVVLAREPWEGTTLPGHLAIHPPQRLYTSRLAEAISLMQDDAPPDGQLLESILKVGGQGPAVGIWEL